MSEEKKPRRMMPYHPRKRKKRSETLGEHKHVESKHVESVVDKKQELNDLEQKISQDVGSYLVLIKEGSAQQIENTHRKAKTDLIKFGPEMQKIAEHMGGALPEVVGQYIDSVDAILHTATGWIDQDKINHCFHSTEKLKKAIGH